MRRRWVYCRHVLWPVSSLNNSRGREQSVLTTLPRSRWFLKILTCSTSLWHTRPTRQPKPGCVWMPVDVNQWQPASWKVDVRATLHVIPSDGDTLNSSGCVLSNTPLLRLSIQHPHTSMTPNNRPKGNIVRKQKLTNIEAGSGKWRRRWWQCGWDLSDYGYRLWTALYFLSWNCTLYMYDINVQLTSDGRQVLESCDKTAWDQPTLCQNVSTTGQHSELEDGCHQRAVSIHARHSMNCTIHGGTPASAHMVGNVCDYRLVGGWQ